MSNFYITLQATRSKKICVCIASTKNGKLVLKGEPITRRIDAINVAAAIEEEMGIIRTEPWSILPWNYRWPKNSGPKKKR